MRHFLNLALLLLTTVLTGYKTVSQETTPPPNPILDPESVVTIPEFGKIQGLSWWTFNFQPRKFHVFHAIPYAEDTSGDKRFKPSTIKTTPLPDSGDGSYLAWNPLKQCPQGTFTKGLRNASDVNLLNLLKNGLWKWTEDIGNIEENMATTADHPWDSEDCLVLNIQTPKIPKEGENLKYPVIFFIHGGSSTQVWGAPFMGFKFMEHDVVLVTINYRLGVLGALNLGIDDAPGNAAMYDCVTALEWVQKYIHHFGGDKDRVVVYGHSAGAMMATHLMLSPLAAGKLSGVIASSGSSLATWATAEADSLKHHLEVCKFAGCFNGDFENPPANTDYDAIYQCMSQKHESELRGALSQYSDRHQREGGLGFDAKIPSIQNSPRITIPKFLEESPAEILRQQKQLPVNLIIGANRHDGSFAFEDIYRKYLIPEDRYKNATFMKNYLIPQMVKAMKGLDKSGAFQHIISKTYFQDGEGMKNGIYEEMLPGLIDLTSIWGFKAPSYEFIKEHAKVNPNSFYYAFDFQGFWSTCDLSGESDIPCGIAHIEDMSFTFQIFPLLREDLAVSKRMVQYFVNFATSGDPNGGSLLYWEPYHPMTHPYLKIDAEDSIGYNCRDSWIDNALEII